MAQADVRWWVTQSRNAPVPDRPIFRITDATHFTHAMLSSSPRSSAQFVNMSGVGKGMPSLRMKSSSSRVSKRCTPRCPALCVKGCFNRARRPDAEIGRAIILATCRINRPGGDSCNGMPALSSGNTFHLFKVAVIWRVNCRSGVISATVSPVLTALRMRSAMASASARLDGALIHVISCVARDISGNNGPSWRHVSVTGAGRSAKENTAFRPTFTGVKFDHSGIAFGARSNPRAIWANRYCG